MIIVALALLGLFMGSFVNALVWRIHEQSVEKGRSKVNKKYVEKLSITKGRSMCPNCKHQLSPSDLVPVLSWITLKGQCRYCHNPISPQYPLIELFVALLFTGSYLWWPLSLTGALNTLVFIVWLMLVVGLIALLVYDIRWYLLPNRLMYPLAAIASAELILKWFSFGLNSGTIINEILAVVVGGGIFYFIFQISGGKWIGGGDVKLGYLLGLIAGTPSRSLLFIFLAALIGTFISLPLIASHRLQRNSVIPFGPFLIVSLIIVQLFGVNILHWYQHLILS